MAERFENPAQTFAVQHSSSDEEMIEHSETDRSIYSRPVAYAFEPIISGPCVFRQSPDSSPSFSSDEDGAGSETEVCRTDSTFWCTCRNCTVLPTITECVCCKAITRFKHKLTSHGARLACIVQNDAFVRVCLDRDVLDVSLLLMADVRADSLTQPIASRTYRLAAYRQFTLWVHGRLGRDVRRVIPSCAVTEIRRIYPQANGDYHGFEFSTRGLAIIE